MGSLRDRWLLPVGRIGTGRESCWASLELVVQQDSPVRGHELDLYLVG